MRSTLAAVPLLGLVCLIQTAAAQSPSPQPSAQATAAESTLKIGDWVRPLSGGQAMQIVTFTGDEAILTWTDNRGGQHHAQFPLADLSVVDGPTPYPPPLVEPQPYRPCPANVINQQGKHECLD
jgi:hypothetical protein